MSREAVVKVAILGTGNIGSDLMYKLLKRPGRMQLAMFAGIDPKSEGLARARAEGIRTSHRGIAAILEEPDIDLVFDATSAKAHLYHANLLRHAGIVAIDLTPAAVGPYVVPLIDKGQFLGEMNVNLITCGGQAVIPLVSAVSRITPVAYAEMVSTVSSASAGLGTRQNIDEFTVTTSRGMEIRGGAKRAKAIIILNPADPPIVMRNTLYVVPENSEVDEQAVFRSVEKVISQMQTYVPGYRLKGVPVMDRRTTPLGNRAVLVMLLEIEGTGDYLPKYAGNLDIMTAAARETGDLFAQHLLNGKAMYA